MPESNAQQPKPLKKLPWPMRDLEKYPNPQDEPFEEMCARTGMRPPDPGEDSITWAMNQPQLPVKPNE